LYGRDETPGMHLGRTDAAGLAGHLEFPPAADRTDVTVPPASGVGTGVVAVGDRALATATAPITVFPAVGVGRTAGVSARRPLAAVAATGLAPTHLAVDFNLPPATSDDRLRTIAESFDAVARPLDVAIVTGHTARYDGCSYPMVGAVTALAVGDPDAVVRPDGARPGDRLVATRGPATLTAGLLAGAAADVGDGDGNGEGDCDGPGDGVVAAAAVANGVPDADLQAAVGGTTAVPGVREGPLTAAAGPATAVWPTLDGGVDGALVGLARAAGVGVTVDRSAFPVAPGVEAVCAAAGVDPWRATAGGLVAAVPPDGVDATLDALASADVPAAAVGEVTDGSAVLADGRPIDPPEDPLWTALGGDRPGE
jgi:hydrogenase maturation factor